VNPSSQLHPPIQERSDGRRSARSYHDQILRLKRLAAPEQAPHPALALAPRPPFQPAPQGAQRRHLDDLARQIEMAYWIALGSADREDQAVSPGAAERDRAYDAAVIAAQSCREIRRLRATPAPAHDRRTETTLPAATLHVALFGPLIASGPEFAVLRRALLAYRPHVEGADQSAYATLVRQAEHAWTCVPESA